MSSPGLGYRVAFSGPIPSSRSPMGIQPPSPLQRTWMICDSSGRRRRNAPTVAGASASSGRARNENPPAEISSTGSILLPRDRGDVRGDVADLLGAQPATEGRHRSQPVRDPLDDERSGWLRGIEIGADVALRARIREGMAP